ncbi:MAG: AAA family ATPase, partial [Hymenobacteraceae bacterium]|nr:AAA family ATPase [Hymenobacteraceae bacterium]
MIKSVRLTNFFSFRDCEITLEPDVTVLVGINGSGKTNLLRAFELLKAGMEGRLREKILNWGGYETIYCRNKLYDDFEGVLGLKFLLDANQLGQFGYPYLEDITCSLSLMRLQSPEDYLLSTRLTVNPDGRKETLLDISGESGYAFEQIDYEKQDRSEEEYRMPVKNAEGTSVKIKGQSFHESALASFNDLSRFPAQTASARGLRNQASYSDFDTRPRSQMRQSIQATGLDVLDSDGANLFQILNTIQLKSTEA